MRVHCTQQCTVQCTIALLLFFSLFTGCDRKDGGQSHPSPGKAEIEKIFERGPIQVTVRIDKKQPTIADRISLELEVIAEEDYEVTLPSFGEKLEQFGIVDFTTSQPELIDGGRTQRSRTYILEPFLSGEYTIPPMAFRFLKEGEPPHELETDEIKLNVVSLLPEDAAELQIHEITGPVEMPRPSRTKLWWFLFGTIVIGSGVGYGIWWYLRNRKSRETFKPPRPAHEIAFDELEKLIAEDLPGNGEIKTFYQRISDILRHYIENRFSIKAPGLTTEEFLYNAGKNVEIEFEASHRRLLKQFLQHCDLVKFAEHQPSTDDIQSTFDTCKHFILQTRIEEEEKQPTEAATA